MRRRRLSQAALSFFCLALGCLIANLGWAQAPPSEAETGGDVEQPAEEGPFAASLRELDEIAVRIDDLEGDVKRTSGAERESIESRLKEEREQLREELEKVIKEVAESQDVPESVLRHLEDILQADAKQLADQYRDEDDLLSALQDQVGSADDEAEKTKLQVEAQTVNEHLVELLERQLENLDHREELGLEAEKDSARFDRKLERRARRLSALLHVAAEEIDALERRPVANDDQRAARDAELLVAGDQLDATADLLQRVVDLMNARGLDTAELQLQLVEETGRVTLEALDAEVAKGLAERWVQRGKEWLAETGPKLLFGLFLFALILGLGKLLAVVLRAVVKRSVRDSEMSSLAKDFIVVTTGRLVMIGAVILGLSQAGVEMKPLLAGLGIAGFIVGFALQDTLSNFASGLMILVYRPFDVGDLIEVAGIDGQVDKMTLVSTSILTLDNQRLIVPNSKIWNDVIRNVTAETRRRVDLIVGVGYGDDIDFVKRVLDDIVGNMDGVLQEPAPIVAVHELASSSVNFTVRAWVATEAYWDMYWALTAQVKRRFDAEGISIPFPQRDVHLHTVAPQLPVTAP